MEARSEIPRITTEYRPDVTEVLRRRALVGLLVANAFQLFSAVLVVIKILSQPRPTVCD